MNYYPQSVFQSIIGVHFNNKKDGPCKCANTHTTLTRTLLDQRRADKILSDLLPNGVGLFCCKESIVQEVV